MWKISIRSLLIINLLIGSVANSSAQAQDKMSLLCQKPFIGIDSLSIIKVMQKTADWQLANPIKISRTNWHWGVFYTGLTALYQTSGDEKYLHELLNVGNQNNWKITRDIYFADQMVIGQTYLDMYTIKKTPEMLTHVRQVMDLHLLRTDTPVLKHQGNPGYLKWWTWCDALYMSPPAFAKMYSITKDQKYLDYMDENWWRTSDYLYSKEDSLFYRDNRAFNQRSDNGKKVFWGRGNGWVIAGLARVIPHLPKDYKGRDKYIQLFSQMAYKLLSVQQDHGLWTISLADSELLRTGESSGSALNTFALAWGINNGILPKKTFEPSVRKAWLALVNNVNEEGCLGYVQQVADSPYPFFAHQSHLYATGAFLLAGKEMISLVKD